MNDTPAYATHSATVLYPAIKAALELLDAVPAARNQTVNRAYNTLHRAYWSECPAPADKPQLRPV